MLKIRQQPPSNLFLTKTLLIPVLPAYPNNSHLTCDYYLVVYNLCCTQIAPFWSLTTSKNTSLARLVPKQKGESETIVMSITVESSSEMSYILCLYSIRCRQVVYSVRGILLQMEHYLGTKEAIFTHMASPSVDVGWSRDGNYSRRRSFTVRLISKSISMIEVRAFYSHLRCWLVHNAAAHCCQLTRTACCFTSWLIVQLCQSHSQLQRQLKLCRSRLWSLILHGWERTSSDWLAVWLHFKST